MRHIFKISLLSVILSIIVFKSAISKSDNDIVDTIIAKYFSTQIIANKEPSNFANNKKSEEVNNKKEEYFDEEGFLDDIIDKVEKKYVHEKSRKEILEAAAEGILSSLDPHSNYLKKDVFSEVKVQLDGEFGGLGIRISTENKLIKVITPIDDTPAAKAGIKAGDYISEVNGKSIYGKSVMEVVKTLRGKPKTSIEITVLREGEAEPLKFNIIRDIIKINAVKHRIYDNIAYIRLSTFSKCAGFDIASEAEKAIEKIGKDKIDGIILDLRNNPGGALDASVNVSSLFLETGSKVVAIKARDSDEISYNSKDVLTCNSGGVFGKKYKFQDSDHKQLLKTLPVAILVNLGSASASEIVAGAIQDNDRGIILGTKTFGKGSVQSLIPLNKGASAMKLTIALYYTPSGRSIQADGIEPDIIVKEAKLETIENKNMRSEADLEGHLQSQIKEIAKENKDLEPEEKDNSILYDDDYQLTRAIDLIKGINLYRKFGKKLQ
ncbi:S41 family peptidase [Rickettsiales bacterium]|nr:S41 family peptidase [Rickettsiales bacterium]